VTQSNDPLFIVDGFQQSNINDIPPTDIASIDVLKDASLTAIYGAKGANGVVIVTTKSAQAARSRWASTEGCRCRHSPSRST
jgi:TonB-dependent SusC/RagA subfamily outer membrane receptor